MGLPPNHPRRIELNDEVHARPPEALKAPVRISFLALIQDPGEGGKERAHLAQLALRLGAEPPGQDANHFSADLGAFRLKWERHTEFSRYMFIVDGPSADPFGDTAMQVVPPDFVSGLPGKVMVATHAAFLPQDGADISAERLSEMYFAGHALVGSEIGGGAGTALTDFRIHPGGFGRVLILDRALTALQAGRLLQRLFEIDSYKTMALLAFPTARGLGPLLGRAEHELSDITATLASSEPADENALLDRLTRLEAEIERQAAENQFRFAASAAYHDLVQRRILELRERRIEGLQTFGEFIERRLGPAMNTCRAVAGRLEALSNRVSRATQLLSTRVDVSQARQNQEILRSMNRRVQMQLRLQQTVEGLSVAAVTYYIVGLVGYLAKGFRPLGIHLEPDLVTGVSIPVVLLLTWLGVGRIRRSATSSRSEADH